jgi:hypothetical protein
MNAKLDRFFTPIGAMQTKIDDLKEENDTMKLKLEEQDAVIREHQLFFERIDAKEREMNCILVGIPENEQWLGHTEDKQKVEHVLSTLGISEMVASWKRIGQPAQQGQHSEVKHRPILLRLKPNMDRTEVLGKKTLLVAPEMGKMKIRTDKHPRVREEWTRLFKVAEDEKQKPESAGQNIFVNKRKRRVMKGTEELDKWSIQLF